MMLTQKQALQKYGVPNETGSGYLVKIQIPYPMRLSWDTKTVVNSISCHHLVANNFLAAFNGILNEYGYDKLKKLGIDLYGGCFNYRKMRGGTEMSMHSWGIAIDLDPERNQLKETSRTARFAKPEYKPMIKIFYDNGFQSLGIEKNYDWMHFQIAP